MNGRIQELANKAVGKRSCYMIEAEYIKFAELIVEECIRKIEDIAESSNNPQPIYRVAVELLEHFGVEE